MHVTINELITTIYTTPSVSICSVGYTEETVQWTTDTAEDTDRQSDSTSDSE